jgi:TolB-like protein/Tfp pilus assembly protein PilF
MDTKKFFSELKRRNIYRVAVAYAVVSWLIIQIATQVFPFFEIPNWAVRLVVLLLILGFPVVLVLSWAFEITPEGIKRESEVAAHKSITANTGRRIVALTIVVAVIATGLLAFRLLRLQSAVKTTVRTTPVASEAAAIPDKSIAVLPFENLSDEKSNAYFAEGIQDEILTRLSKIAALKVISRTSTQKYESAPGNLREIGRQLGVANVLEGSVQKVANAVHINVQLIRAATDQHIWAESYNRTLNDVFGVEGEVASKIAAQLNAKLTGAEEKAMADKLTQNAAAYDAYLRGISVQAKGSGIESAREVAAAYAQAVQLDPNFALAWARLALARSYLYFNGIDLAANSAAAVKEAADRALALQPDSGEAWIAQGVYRYRVLRDFPGALKSYREALKRLPNNALVLEQMGHVERRLGQTEAASKHYQMAAQLDPRNIANLFTVADLFTSLRRFDDAQTVLNRILQISPGNEDAYAAKAGNFQAQGRLNESAKELSNIAPNSDDPVVVLTRTLQFTYERRFDAAITELKPVTSPANPVEPRFLALLGWCQEWAGRKSDAHATFERVVAAIKPSPASVVPVDARQLLCFLALAHASLGEKEKALEEARRAVAEYKDDILARPFAEQVLAQVQASFGDVDSAIAALPHLLEVPNGITRSDLRLDPVWDPLRKDSRFARLIAEPQVK